MSEAIRDGISRRLDIVWIYEQNEYPDVLDDLPTEAVVEFSSLHNPRNLIESEVICPAGMYFSGTLVVTAGELSWSDEVDLLVDPATPNSISVPSSRGSFQENSWLERRVVEHRTRDRGATKYTVEERYSQLRIDDSLGQVLEYWFVSTFQIEDGGRFGKGTEAVRVASGRATWSEIE